MSGRRCAHGHQRPRPVQLLRAVLVGVLGDPLQALLAGAPVPGAGLLKDRGAEPRELGQLQHLHQGHPVRQPQMVAGHLEPEPLLRGSAQPPSATGRKLSLAAVVPSSL